jgi:hypothetical protein
MSEYKLKTGKVGEAVVGAYKKIENAFVDAFLEKDADGEGAPARKGGKVTETVVGAYQKIEDSVVSGYKKIEDKFVDTFLERAEPDQQAEEEKAETSGD